MKNLSTYYRIRDSHKKRIFTIYSWIIPVGICSFFLLSFFRAYIFCKIQSLLNLKFISVSKFLFVYGFVGSLLCLIISIIPSFIPCSRNNKFDDIDFICNVTNFDYTQNSTIYYYDSYSIYFSNLWKNDRKFFINVFYIFLILLKICLTFAIRLFSVIIIKNLGPEYLICSNSIFYFISEGLDTIASMFYNKFYYYKLYDILDELCSISGTILYLEFIELNFLGLSFNLKKNIKIRSQKDSKSITNDKDEDDSEIKL